jgi:hypothetical protein
MEAKINIAEILRNKPRGIRLYSPIFGNCTFCYIREDTNDICVKKYYEVIEYFNSEGLYFTLGEVMLFPSKEMRVWDKFAWKKGDALSCGVDNLCIFEKWANEEYTEFYAKFVTPNYSGNTFKTEKWSKETNEAVIKQYVSNIEGFKGGKLNLTTLEIEKTQPEFKVGDIAFADYSNRQDVFIVSDKTNLSEGYNSFISLDLSGLTLNMGYRTSFFKSDLCKLRLATEEEKQQLFDALAKEGKAWDAEKKQIVDLKPKCEFKPFDKVVVFDELAKKWECSMFSHYSKNYEGKEVVTCIGGCTYFKVLPYNEETAKLVGTRNNVED